MGSSASSAVAAPSVMPEKSVPPARDQPRHHHQHKFVIICSRGVAEGGFVEAGNAGSASAEGAADQSTDAPPDCVGIDDWLNDTTRRVHSARQLDPTSLLMTLIDVPTIASVSSSTVNNDATGNSTAALLNSPLGSSFNPPAPPLTPVLRTQSAPSSARGEGVPAAVVPPALLFVASSLEIDSNDFDENVTGSCTSPIAAVSPFELGNANVPPLAP